MKLKILGSSSHGNCYLLEGANQTLMLECGVRMAEVKKALGYDISRVAGALLTHEHGDHSAYALDVLKAGIQIYASEGTIEMIKTGGFYPHPIMYINRPFQVGEFRVIAFDAEHDAEEPLGFYIQHPECGVVLFATDTRDVNTLMKGVNTALIEANFSHEIMDDRIMKGSLNVAQARRIEASHMSLERCIFTLKEFDLSQMLRIVLLHASDGNSNAREFQYAVQSATGIQTYVADKGLEIEINKIPF